MNKVFISNLDNFYGMDVRVAKVPEDGSFKSFRVKSMDGLFFSIHYYDHETSEHYYTLIGDRDDFKKLIEVYKKSDFNKIVGYDIEKILEMNEFQLKALTGGKWWNI